MSEWVSVKDRLPFEGGDVAEYREEQFLITDGHSVKVGDFCAGRQGENVWMCFSDDNDIHPKLIKYWMELPELPQ